MAYIAPMEVLFEDIKKTLDAEHISFPTVATQHPAANTGSPDTILQPPATRSTQLNQQLEVSREVELALQEMKLSDEASLKRPPKGQDRSCAKKDVPDSAQAAVDLKTSERLSDRSQAHDSGVF